MRAQNSAKKAAEPREDMLKALERLRSAPAKRQQLSAWLRKKGKTPAALRLAERLASCRPLVRCDSGACPVCMVKRQFRVAQAISRCAAKAEGQLFTLTAALVSSAVPRGQLVDNSHADHVRRLKRKLHDLPVQWVIGGTDYSLNEHAAGRYEPFWLPHLYVVGECEDLDAVRACLKGEEFRGTDSVPRPYHAKPWDGSRKAMFYTLKVDFARRVGVDDAERHDRRTGTLRLCRATNHQQLRSAEKLELLLHLDNVGLSARVFSMHCQVHQHGRKYPVRLTP